MSEVDVAPWRRQTTETETTSPAETKCSTAAPQDATSSTSPTATSSFPTPPAPPPPPMLNGISIPTIRLKTEISNEPPAKLQSAMNKDKKPFTYAPGGIDFSEIKSPRMQRRLMRNAQTPDDVLLPATTSAPVDPNSLPPAAVVGMTPHLAIPVFPQNNNVTLRKTTPDHCAPQPAHSPPPPPPSPKSPMSNPSLQSQPQMVVPVVTQDDLTGVSLRRTSSSTPNQQAPPPPPRSPELHPPIQKTAPLTAVPIFSQNGITGVTLRRTSSPTPIQQIPPPPQPKSPELHPPYQEPMTHMAPPASAPNNASTHGHFNKSTPPPPPPKSPELHPPYHMHTPQRVPSPVPPNTNVTQLIINGQSNQRSTNGHNPQPTDTNKIVFIKSNNDTEPSAQLKPREATAAFPTLRETPAPWLQKHQQSQESVPSWINRNSERNHGYVGREEPEQRIYERKSQTVPAQQAPQEPQNRNSSAGTHIIPIRIEGSEQTIKPQGQNNSQGWQDKCQNGHYVIINNKLAQECADQKPIQSKSFKVIQKITGSEDDSTGFNSNVLVPYNSRSVPLRQLKKLHQYDNDQAVIDRVLAQEKDTFSNMETDPRYRGAEIPSKSFKMLQNMTDNNRVITNANNIRPDSPNCNYNHNHNHNRETVNSNQYRLVNQTPQTVINNSRPGNYTNTQNNGTMENNRKGYIPPSERPAEQELRKYTGSSIPSRSFKMLQAMTATQDPVENAGEYSDKNDIDEEPSKFLSTLSHPNPWPSPPKTPEGVHSLWQHYLYLYNLVITQLPHLLSHTSTSYSTLSSSKAILTEPIEIVTTDDDSDINKSRTLISNFHINDETRELKGYRPSHRYQSVTEQNQRLLNNNLIVNQVVANNYENNVSLTVCLPLRRRSKPTAEYHEEITLNNSIINKSSDNVNEIHCQQNNTNSKVHSHSESGSEDSIDFWKEIARDEDDLYFKNRHKSALSHLDKDDQVKHKTLTEHEQNPKTIKGKQTENYDCEQEHPNETSSSGSYNVYECSAQTRRTSKSAIELLKSKLNHQTDQIVDEEQRSKIMEHQTITNNATDNKKDLEMNSSEVDQAQETKSADSEFRKLSKYERASTHSRLYRLLLRTSAEVQAKRNQQLNQIDDQAQYPHEPSCQNKIPANVSSSPGINSSLSPITSAVNEKLVNELMQDLIKWKQDLNLEEWPPEKLREVAIRSLQTDSRPASPLIAPIISRNVTSYRRCQSYSSDSSSSSLYYPGYDILPSKAFKNLTSGRSTPTNWPKCPLADHFPK